MQVPKIRSSKSGYPRPRRLGSVFINSRWSLCASVASSNVVTLEAPRSRLNLLTFPYPRHTAENRGVRVSSGTCSSFEASARNTGSVLVTAMSPGRAAARIASQSNSLSGSCLRIRACSLSRSGRTRRKIATAKPCGQPCPMILSPFNSAKASYSENKISAPVPGASSLKNAKLASSASLDLTLAAKGTVKLKQPLDARAQVRRGLLAIWSDYVGNRLFDLIALVRHQPILLPAPDCAIRLVALHGDFDRLSRGSE